MPEVRLDTLAAIRGKHALWCYCLECKCDKHSTSQPSIPPTSALYS